MIPEKIDMISKILAFFLPNIFGKPKELFKVSVGIIYFLDYNQLTMVLLKYQCAFSELSGYYSPIFEEQEYEPSDHFKEKYT